MIYVVCVIAGLLAVAVVFAAVMRAENRRDDRDGEAEAVNYVMSLKLGKLWRNVIPRTYLLTLRAIIQAAHARRPHTEFREALDLIGTLTSPAATTAPPVCPGTGAGPGDGAAAAVAPLATPPGDRPAAAAPDPCAYQDWPPLWNMLSDATIARGFPAIKDGA